MVKKKTFFFTFIKRNSSFPLTWSYHTEEKWIITWLSHNQRLPILAILWLCIRRKWKFGCPRNKELQNVGFGTMTWLSVQFLIFLHAYLFPSHFLFYTHHLSHTHTKTHTVFLPLSLSLLSVPCAIHLQPTPMAPERDWLLDTLNSPFPPWLPMFLANYHV